MSGSGTPSRPLRRRSIFAPKGRFGPNMTPMVDVVLVILIFFMAATVIVGHEWFLRADLPETGDELVGSGGFDLPTPVLDLELFVGDEGVRVRGMGAGAIGLEEALERIGSLGEGVSEGLIVRIGASDGVPFGAVVAVHEAGHARGMRVSVR